MIDYRCCSVVSSLVDAIHVCRLLIDYSHWGTHSTQHTGQAHRGTHTGARTLSIMYSNHTHTHASHSPPASPLDLITITEEED